MGKKKPRSRKAPLPPRKPFIPQPITDLSSLPIDVRLKILDAFAHSSFKRLKIAVQLNDACHRKYAKRSYKYLKITAYPSSTRGVPQVSIQELSPDNYWWKEPRREFRLLCKIGCLPYDGEAKEYSRMPAEEMEKLVVPVMYKLWLEDTDPVWNNKEWLIKTNIHTH
ncbi:uncharacterized protein I303_104974 [Kwoniella dejecticola CBS 10117]|uniref:Uncharacterized protein n=1 Tax=Kwoniella dejecticola CBS 10117 TaxID=1296121 RepID=A0A1A6A3T9_9TREE|nr:uncharacterized protein I303_05581 [Kwoniella dejecticola CBS 10117]OBR84722.1 hypothetical protein I303_05581 [Kwoniella dejecticola CBS 10117]